MLKEYSTDFTQGRLQVSRSDGVDGNKLKKASNDSSEVSSL